MAALLYTLLALYSFVPAQRHLPLTNIFRSPGLLLIDTQVESPAVYDGSGAARRVSQGQTFEVQIFAPRVAGQRIYEYGFSVDKPADRRLPFVLTGARDWQDNELMDGKPNRSLIFHSTRFGFAPLPRTGHVMTLTFTATEDMTNLAPLPVILSITVVSDPPRRVNQIIGRSSLYWG